MPEASSAIVFLGHIDERCALVNAFTGVGFALFDPRNELAAAGMVVRVAAVARFR